MTAKAAKGNATFAVTADISEPHRQVPKHPEDWKLLGCQVRRGGEVFVNTVSISWCAEQTLLCTKKTKLFLTFPEDFGCHYQKGPSSIWSLREFQLVHGVSEACRGAGFQCQLGRANFRRPIGILTNIASLFDQLYKGWPCLVHDKEDLQYRGPLPNHCPFVPQHHNLKGVDAADHFTSASSHTLGDRFWSCFFFFFEKIGTVQPSSLRDGDMDSTIAAFSSSPCLSPRSAPSLAKGSGSLSLFYGSWKNNSFTGLQGC